ncbi:MAG: protein serine/threonine phosphatase 2C family protein, partial [Verrucomicrobia bacterium]|nr:protein serine/threonine phosphatase 2C family protein [Verrucomicrobiota bacterium]
DTFSKAQKKADGNIHQALESTIDKIHKQVAVNKDMKYMGSTLAAAYIQKNGIVYAATVGDTEIFSYEKDEAGETKVRPLSVVRNWGDPQEITRAVRLAKTAEEAEKRKSWSLATDPKKLRVRNRIGLTLNLSRSIGDPSYREVSIKPEITISQINEGKIALLCDGVTDFVSQREVASLIGKSAPEEDLAAKIADYALVNKKSTDNVTAMVLDVKVKS